MILTIDLSDEKEAALKAKAQMQGVTAEEYAARVLGMDLSDGLPIVATKVSGEDKARAFESWSDGFPDTPPLSDEAISRESLYPDRW